MEWDIIIINRARVVSTGLGCGPALGKDDEGEYEGWARRKNER
jgi:hypothetical protein